ncbi:MAG: Hsp20/alpha crystallin family protein [Burkholderiaceae bacterium]
MSQLSIHRSDPFGSLFDDLFNDFFQRQGVPAQRASAVPQVNRARMDVIDKGNQFEIAVDLPGVKKEDIQVAVEGARVAISAETKRENETKEGERVLHSERFVTSYARSFELPVEVTEDGADARFEDGVLTLALPKRAAVTSKRLTIK